LVITLITDFGTAGPYVGSMKGVILSIHPDARIVDIAHDIRPQDVDEAAFVLKQAYPFFPAGTIHVVVVDPGVGSDRAVLAVRTERYIFLAPDNGVLKYVFDACPDARVFRVTNQDFSLSPVSRTFHGRDVFAPAAAHLSRGVDIERMGEPFTEYVRGEVQRPEVRPREIRGEIVFIDGFGNGITNIEEALFAGREVDSISVRSHVIRGLSGTYSDVGAGEPLALVGSGGTLEISVCEGNARERMAFQKGDAVTIILK
jgi:S-adenosylmethionine hydrolase